MSFDLAIRAVGGFVGGGLLLLTTIVLIRYFIEWRGTPGRAGLLPLHIFMIAASYDLMVLGFTLGIVLRPVTSWRIGIILPALIIGLAAMFVMANFQHRTYSHKLREQAEKSAKS